MIVKSEQIKKTIQETKQKRKSQTCKVYEVKLDKSHLFNSTLNHLNKLFLEAKWLYNYQLSKKDIFNFSYKINRVIVLNKDKKKERRKLDCLSSQMKQSLVDRVKQNIINLSRSKKNGNKIGGLKFKSQINSIPLKQYGNTYKILDNNYIKIQGLKQQLKVNGLKQIPQESEIANANLIRRNNNFYLKVTCFLPRVKKIKTNRVIGLDFGIKNNIIDSDGNKYNFQFPESKQLKKISKKLHRAKLGSKNRYKVKCKLNKTYTKLTNQKKDVKNKFISKLVKENDYICIQDENIAGWKSSKLKGFGRKIHHSIMEGIISDLKHKPETLMMGRFFPSTQLCPICKKKNKLSLHQRVYICSCGYVEDRDKHSARNIKLEGLKQISTVLRNKMLLEEYTILNN